jgi:undecaprenyl-diphosphatase
MDMISTLFAWIGAHPGWAGVGVFLIAFLESLAVVGLVLPGAAMMFGVGALVGTDVLPLWPTLAWAALGAIGGDGVSFWLGRRYHMQLKVSWPLRNHPELIQRATDFFYRHGGKSVLLGRFVGPIRPVIPAVAGMLEMPTRRFLAVNIISGVLWAPVYVFPGMIFATSLGLASEVAARLAVLIGTLLGLLFMLVWLQKHLFNWLHRHTWPWIHRTLTWARLHPVMGEIPAALLDPAHPEARGLTLLALLLLAATLLFAGVLHAMGHQGLLLNLDSYLYYTLEGLRTPWMDRLLVALGLLGDWQVLLPLSLAIWGWLRQRGHRQAAGHWLAAVSVGALLSLALGWNWVGRENPLEASLHGGELLSAMASYGFISILIARERPEPRRWPIYTAAAALVLGIAFTRLYLGEHRLSGVLGALTLGLAWIALLGIGYRNHPANRVPPRRLAGFALLVVGVSAGIYGWQQHDEVLARHAIRQEPDTLDRAAWWQLQWQQLPAYRADMRGVNNHPLNLQYAGTLAQLRDALERQGWHNPPPLTALSWLAWLNDQTPIVKLPVLPQVHGGHNESLLLVKADGSAEGLLALRLWPTRYRLEPGSVPLWTGNVSLLRPVTRSGVTAPRTQPDFNGPLQRLLDAPLPLPQQRHHRDIGQDGWDGEVVLLTEPER